jgi:tol-pal system protein YbgF
MAPSAPPVVAGTPAPDNPFNVTVTTPADVAVTSDPFAVPQDVIDTVADTQQTAQQLMPPQADAPVLGIEPTVATEPATSAQAVMMPTVPATAAAVNPGQQLATAPPQMTGVPIQQTGAPPVTTVTDAGLQTPTAAPIANAGRPAQVVTVDSPESEKAYGDAFNLLKSGEYEPAINALRAFLAQYPASQYVDNAQYWLGESFFVMRQFEGAIAEYQRLTQLYPDSQKYSHALLKIGYSYHELGQADLARATLEDLKERFPGSTAARLADERIQRIRLEPAR